MRATNRICPDCHLDLRIAERQGVEIDFCPQCRGVWLERGELEKILARESEWDGRRDTPLAAGPYRRDHDEDEDDDDDEHRRRRTPGYGSHPLPAQQHPHKKKGFLGGLLGDIFD